VSLIYTSVQVAAETVLPVEGVEDFER